LQEDIEQKSVNLAVQTGKVGGKELVELLKKAYAKITAKKNEVIYEDDTIKGEQSVKDLIGQGQGVNSLDVGDSGIRDFRKIANKYGVDFAIVKDKEVTPPKYTVFFKAKDADAITNVLKEYSAKQVKRNKHKQKERPSVLDKLKKFKAIVAKMPRKEIEKKKEKER